MTRAGQASGAGISEDDDRGGGDSAAGKSMTITQLMRGCAALRVLAFGLTLSACDKCGDFPWSNPGSCKAGPSPN